MSFDLDCLSWNLKPRIHSHHTQTQNTNGSQFFITFAKTSWLDGRHTVFGELESGDAVLDKMELAGTSAGTPKQGIQITDCGELKV